MVVVTKTTSQEIVPNGRRACREMSPAAEPAIDPVAEKRSFRVGELLLKKMHCM